MRIISTAPTYSLNGVNVFSARLVHGLNTIGIDARILLTAPWKHDPKPLPLPDVPIDVLPVSAWSVRSKRHRALIDYLEAHAPCVYLPNHDFHHAVVAPRLSDRIRVVGILHGDDPQHYEHARRMGPYWDATVAVSKTIARKAEAKVTIPYGVEVPHALEPRPHGPLRIVYAGRLEHDQKRVRDLIEIARLLREKHVDFTLSVIGDGPLRSELAPHVHLLGTLPPDRVIEVLEASDVLILVSRHEGLPIIVLEAMAHGAVPIVSRVESGIDELIEHGKEGLTFSVGDTKSAASLLEFAATHRSAIEAMRQAAHARVRAFDVRTMVNRYAALAHQLMALPPTRARGRILFPPEETWRDVVPPGLFTLRRRMGL